MLTKIIRMTFPLGTLGLVIFLYLKRDLFQSFLSRPGNHEYRTTAIRRGDLIQQVTLAGTVHPQKQANIVAPYDGYIKKIHVKVGQSIRTGDPVISIVESLASQHQKTFPLRAPFSGTVVQILQKEGTYVRNSGGQSESTLVRIDDLSSYYIYSNVPELDILKLKVGQVAKVRISAILNQNFQAKLEEIALAANSSERFGGNRKPEYLAVLRLEDPDKRIKPGMSAIMDLITSKKEDVLILPHEFIDRQDNQHFLTLSNGETVNIKIGMQNERLSEVKTDLQEGALIRQVDFMNREGV